MCWENECKCNNKPKPEQVIEVPVIHKVEPESNEFRIHIGKRMVSARKIAGLSLEEASKLFGWTKQALNKYELGKIEIDSLILIKFSNAYKLPVDFFIRKGIEIGEIKWHKHKLKY